MAGAEVGVVVAGAEEQKGIVRYRPNNRLRNNLDIYTRYFQQNNLQYKRSDRVVIEFVRDCAYQMTHDAPQQSHQIVEK